jgi:hypothetical protein
MDAVGLQEWAVWVRGVVSASVRERVSVVTARGSPWRASDPGAVAQVDDALARGVDLVEDVAAAWFHRVVGLRLLAARGRAEISSAAPGEEAERWLLLARCRAWREVMPWVFEHEPGYVELLAPAGVLTPGGVMERLVAVLPEAACREVEVFGWLHQFYGAERKDAVFAGFRRNGKASAADIATVTQLFTPEWIARYLVQNSVGRVWVAGRPGSRLARRMELYVPPPVPEGGVRAVSCPQELTVLDPACGAGHLLLYAFELLYEIYEEAGYAAQDIPGLILTHNLHGLEIDARVAAVASFSLTVKAWDRCPEAPPSVAPRVRVLSPVSFSAEELAELTARSPDPVAEADLFTAFDDAASLGALIRVRDGVTRRVRERLASRELDEGVRARVGRVLEQAEWVCSRHAVAVANPPYMSSRHMSPAVSAYLRERYPSAKADLYSAFMGRCREFVSEGGLVAMITMHSWMFTGTYAPLRRELLAGARIVTLAHLGAGAFEAIKGQVVQTVAFVLEVGAGLADRPGVFVRATECEGFAAKREAVRRVAAGAAPELCFVRAGSVFAQIPGSPIAYWLEPEVVEAYRSSRLVGDVARTAKGMDTGDNARFLRRWFEVPWSATSLSGEREAARWFPYNKGGGARRWYGLREHVIDWAEGGAEVKAAQANTSRRARVANEQLFFTEGFTWSTVSPGAFGARYTPGDALFDNGGSTLFAEEEALPTLGGMLNTRLSARLLEFLAPTINTQPGDVARLPVPETLPEVGAQVWECVSIAKADWDSYETSMDFQSSPLLFYEGPLVERVHAHLARVESRRARMRVLECEIEEAFSMAFGVPAPAQTEREPTLSSPDVESVAADLVSFGVGCILGRYSLDAPGLVLADQGSSVRDYVKRVPDPSLAPAESAVVPLLAGVRRGDGLIARFEEFLAVAFGREYLAENLDFLASHLGVGSIGDWFLGPAGGSRFYSDHVRRYKNRPIYWLFSSSSGSFNALVSMHRYRPGTVAEIGEQLADYRKALQATQGHRLRGALLEIEAYRDDVLSPLQVDPPVIDLDDGVQANYPKFGAALRKVTAL